MWILSEAKALACRLLNTTRKKKKKELSVLIATTTSKRGEREGGKSEIES